MCSFCPGRGGSTPSGKLCQRGPDQDSGSGGTGSHRADAVGPGGVPGLPSCHHSKQPACACTCAPPSSGPPTPPSSAPPSACHTTISRVTSSSRPAAPAASPPPSGWPPPAPPTSAPPICAAIAFVFTAASAAPPPTAASTSETSMCQRPGRQRAQGGRPPWPARLQSDLLSLLSASDGDPKPFPRTPTPHQPTLPLPTEDPPPAQRNAHLRHRG